MSESGEGGGYDIRLAEDDFDLRDGTPGGDDPHSLVDLINRVLDRGVVITGDVTISVAGVDLVYLGLSAVLTSVSTARRTLLRPGPEADGPGGRHAGR